MSREHHKDLSRRLAVSLEERTQRRRAERHGKPQTRRAWYTETVECAAGTPGAKRSVETNDAGEIVVVHRLTVQINRQVPVTEAFKVRVAAGPTGTYGEKNEPPQVAKKVKKEGPR